MVGAGAAAVEVRAAHFLSYSALFSANIVAASAFTIGAAATTDARIGEVCAFFEVKQSALLSPPLSPA